MQFFSLHVRVPGGSELAGKAALLAARHIVKFEQPFTIFFALLFITGRGGNKWIAPAGCAMFSLHVRVPGGSELADKLPFLQHIASAAVVEAVRTMPGYEVISFLFSFSPI